MGFVLVSYLVGGLIRLYLAPHPLLVIFLTTSLLTFCSATNSGLLDCTSLPRASRRSCSCPACIHMSTVSSFILQCQGYAQVYSRRESLASYIAPFCVCLLFCGSCELPAWVLIDNLLLASSLNDRACVAKRGVPDYGLTNSVFEPLPPARVKTRSREEFCVTGNQFSISSLIGYSYPNLTG